MSHFTFELLQKMRANDPELTAQLEALSEEELVALLKKHREEKIRQEYFGNAPSPIFSPAEHSRRAEMSIATDSRSLMEWQISRHIGEDSDG
jgi:hypothetical protein